MGEELRPTKQCGLGGGVQAEEGVSQDPEQSLHHVCRWPVAEVRLREVGLDMKWVRRGPDNPTVLARVPWVSHLELGERGVWWNSSHPHIAGLLP